MEEQELVEGGMLGGGKGSGEMLEMVAGSCSLGLGLKMGFRKYFMCLFDGVAVLVNRNCLVVMDLGSWWRMRIVAPEFQWMGCRRC